MTKYLFIERSNIVHANKFDYSLIPEILVSHQKVSIICPIHGKFYQSYPSHLEGYGCKICSYGVMGSKRKWTIDMFEKKIIKKFKDKLQIDKSTFTNLDNEVSCSCKVHGSFKGIAKAILSTKYGCAKCANEITKKTNEEYVKELIQKHEGRVISLEPYRRAMTKIDHRCTICNHIWKQKPNQILGGTGCPKCSLSKGILRISEYLERECGIAKEDIEFEKIFIDCTNSKTGRRLPFDIYIKSREIVIEYDGEFHFQPIRYGLNQSQQEADLRLLLSKERDSIKTDFCTIKGLKLIRIKHTLLDDFLNKKHILKNILDKKDHLIILSGGLDSTTLLYKLVREYGSDHVIAISFDYGQTLEIEIDKAKLSCKILNVKHTVLDVKSAFSFMLDRTSLLKSSFLTVDREGTETPNTYVPSRNLIFTVFIYAISEVLKTVTSIYLGIQPHSNFETYWDTTPEFLCHLNSLLMKVNTAVGINLRAPFVFTSKSDIVKTGIELEVPYENTHTCYNPQLREGEYYSCGICPSCSERLMAFKKNNLVDSIKYI